MMKCDVQTQHLQDLNCEEFQSLAGQVMAWTAKYLSDAKYPLLPQIQPGELAAVFPNTPPQQGVSAEHLFETFQRVIAKNCTHWNSSRFMGYFGLGSSSIGVLAQTLEAALNQTRMLWSTSPAATELEQVTLNWIRQLLGLPPNMFGMMHTNSRIDLALVAALEARGYDISNNGLAGMPVFCCYASTEAHGANEKAMVFGLGKKNLRKIAVDENYRMDPIALRHAIEKDIQAGYIPLMVIATIGTTSTTSIDPVREIADICEEYDLWLHCDAAYAGLFAIDPEMRWILDGCERADSFTTNPHKALFMPFDHSILYIKRPELLKSAFRSRSAYLMHGSIEGGTDLYDFTDKIPHRFPALSLWMTLSYFGVEGIVAHHREQRRLAHLFEALIEEDDGFELMAPTPLSVVCFRARPRGMDNGREINAFNRRLMHSFNNRSAYFISDTLVSGKCVLRVAIGNIKTSEEDVRGLWKQLNSILDGEMATVSASSTAL